MRFLWTFVAAIAMFLAGAVFAIGYGVHQLFAGKTSAGYAIAYATLAIALVAEGTSWIRAIRQSRREAEESGLSLIEYLRGSRDPNVKMVLFEDTAALAGIALAFLGILFDQLTGPTYSTPQHLRCVAAAVSDAGGYELVVTPPATRALSDRLPEPIATAVIEFIVSSLIADPRRVGKPLRGELTGIWSARRGTYRILYRICDVPREIIVLRIEHRRDVHRPR